MEKENKNTVGYGTSPTNDSRACLCIDSDTYSIKCCQGYLMNQGIGPLTR